jgi:hypothetical protein
MPNKRKNRDAAILGKLSGLKRRGEKNWKVLGLTKKQIAAATAAFSKLGCSKGGTARAAALDAATRKSIAQKAIAARWSKEANH